MRAIVMAVVWVGVGLGVTEILADALKESRRVAYPDTARTFVPLQSNLGDLGAGARALR